MSKSVHILSARVRLRGKVLRTKKKNKMGGNFGYMRSSNRLCSLDQMWHVGALIQPT